MVNSITIFDKTIKNTLKQVLFSNYWLLHKGVKSYILLLPKTLGNRLRSVKFQMKRKVVPIDGYRRLVMQEAWRAWRQLPFSTRTWLGIDDMIESGMWITYQYLNWHYNFNDKCARQHPPGFTKDKSQSVTTGLYHCLHNMYIREYIEVYGAWKRGWEMKDGKLVSVKLTSLQALQDRMSQDGQATMDDVVGQIPELYTSEDHILDNMLTECFVVPALTRVYQQASPKLQQGFVDWFWYSSDKVHTKGRPFRKMAKEFRELCQKERLHCEDCIHVVRSPQCLNSLSHNIFSIPYDHSCIPVVKGQPVHLVN